MSQTRGRVTPPTVAHDDPAQHSRAELLGLITAATAFDGHPPFGEHVLLTLNGQRQITHAAFESHRDGHLAGYLLLCEGLDAWYADVVTHPDHRNRGVGTELIQAAAQHVASHGGGNLRIWAYSNGAPDTLAARLGMTQYRAVSYQTRPLSDPVEIIAPPGTILRTLRPDETDAWLSLSNRAFLGHPENGNWSRADLDWRLEANWTDLTRFVVLADTHTDQLLGGVWTKVEPDSTDGELYIVAIDPRHAGRGLGRVVVQQALHTLAVEGLTRASLYVDTTNTGALALYAKTGFTPQHTDRCFKLRIPCADT